MCSYLCHIYQICIPRPSSSMRAHLQSILQRANGAATQLPTLPQFIVPLHESGWSGYDEREPGPAPGPAASTLATPLESSGSVMSFRHVGHVLQPQSRFSVCACRNDSFQLVYTCGRRQAIGRRSGCETRACTAVGGACRPLCTTPSRCSSRCTGSNAAPHTAEPAVRARRHGWARASWKCASAHAWVHADSGGGATCSMRSTISPFSTRSA
eukprot:SAG31_NODE_4105_length_3577_cov_3.755894_2_plen_212_part_00